MPDSRHHRGPHPHDRELFRDELHPVFREAVSHLSWLLTQGYAVPSALKLVGDRFNLTERQRRGVMRSACSDQSLESRSNRCVPLSQLAGQAIEIDGFNLLTTIEAALAGGVLLRGRDGCIRDMASMHGSYRRVAETVPALILIGELLAECGIVHCQWWLDQPVSNSGRLRGIILEQSAKRDWPWSAELVPDPDQVLRESTGIVVTADGPVLDDCGRWCNLAYEIIRRFEPPIPIVDLRDAHT